MAKKAVTELEEVATIDVDEASPDETREGIYEIGYHILPTVSEENLTKVVKEFFDFLKEQGAVSIGDRFPAKMELAYSIAKRVAGKITHFNEAYFGWVAVTMPRTGADAVKRWLDENPSVLRHLIITTTRDEVAMALSGRSAAEVAAAPTGTLEKPKREEEKTGEVSEAALDEALKTIATEDAKVEE